MRLKSKWKLRYMSVMVADFDVYVSKEWVKNGHSRHKSGRRYELSGGRASKYLYQFKQLRAEQKIIEAGMPLDMRINPGISLIEPSFIYLK